MNSPVTEAELHAWVDGCLAPERQRDVDAYLALRPDEATRLNAYRQQTLELRGHFHSVLAEPLPDTLAALTPAKFSHRAANDGISWRAPLRFAAMLALTLAGGAGGWLLRGEQRQDRGTDPQALSAQHGSQTLAHRAALAHAVYSPEVRHAVEVGADQQQHLVAWLSKRLGAALKPPQLTALGYTLEGGRLLPGQSGPVAQFMYRDGGGARLTLYVSTEQRENRQTAFRFTQEGPVGVFYWIDGKFGYALSGSLDRNALGKVADAVYAQLEPAT